MEINIEDFIPQRAPFKFIDKLIDRTTGTEILVHQAVGVVFLFDHLYHFYLYRLVASHLFLCCLHCSFPCHHDGEIENHQEDDDADHLDNVEVPYRPADHLGI